MPTAANRLAGRALRALPRAQFSRALGWVSDLEGPSGLVGAAVRTFTAVYGVDLDDVEVPVEGWRSFDAFFTRRLREGARRFPADDRSIPAPADGAVRDCGSISDRSELLVKGTSYSVPELLDRADAAGDYRGGAFVVVYLAPPDYHRVHASFGGTVARVRAVPGEHFPVNRIGEALVPNLFAVNERLVIEQVTELPDGTTLRVATVLVGAIGVRRIETPLWSRTEPVQRGDELGVFHLGSTVVVLLDRPAGFQVSPGERVQAGSPIGAVDPSSLGAAP